MFGYIYETTNKINGMKYIGQKASSEFVESYKGSGTNLKEAFKEFGKENFETVVLCWCESKDDLDEKEIYYIKKFDAVNSDMYYNLAAGGQGFTKGGKFTQSHKDKLSEGKLGEKNPNYHKPPNEKQLSGLEKGRHQPATEKQKQAASKARKGSVTSEETKQALRNAILGRRFVTDGNGTTKQVKPEEIDYYLSLGWRFGKK